MKDDQFYDSKEESENSSDVIVALVVIVCGVIAASICKFLMSLDIQAFSVESKVAVVTGGSRGIGEMLASGFLANGAKVYITRKRMH